MDWNSFEQSIAPYLLRFPSEEERLGPCIQFLAGNAHDARIDRTNFDGHLTASAFLISREMDRLLMIFHKRLARWLQPGGHVDTSDTNLVTAAMREAHEETGVPLESLQLFPINAGDSIPMDIDSHWIPASEKRGEPGHFHHDVRFLFLVNSETALAPSQKEVTDIDWFPLDQVKQWDGFANVVSKIIEFRQ